MGIFLTNGKPFEIIQTRNGLASFLSSIYISLVVNVSNEFTNQSVCFLKLCLIAQFYYQYVRLSHLASNVLILKNTPRFVYFMQSFGSLTFTHHILIAYVP